MPDKIGVSVINFEPKADKADNLSKIQCYINMAAAMTADVILFPELCTTGYDVFSMPNVPREEKEMLCEPADGETAEIIASLAKQNGINICYGFAERAGDRCYNACNFITPTGEIYTYRKIHLFGSEGLFFDSGDTPLIIDTDWGKVGVGICFDTYSCPELLRHYASKGVRLYLNPTAMAYESTDKGAIRSFRKYYKTTLEYNVINTGMFILSANLTGLDRVSVFGGGSVIMGCGKSIFKRPRVRYYVGDVKNSNAGFFMANLDLSLSNPRLFVPNAATGEVAFKPELYKKWN